MEMIVIFNMGRDAALAGKARVAPDRVDYPTRVYGAFEKVVPVQAKLSASAKRAWLQGYDAEAFEATTIYKKFKALRAKSL